MPKAKRIKVSTIHDAWEASKAGSNHNRVRIIIPGHRFLSTNNLYRDVPGLYGEGYSLRTSAEHPTKAFLLDEGGRYRGVTAAVMFEN